MVQHRNVDSLQGAPKVDNSSELMKTVRTFNFRNLSNLAFPDLCVINSMTDLVNISSTVILTVPHKGRYNKHQNVTHICKCVKTRAM